MHRSSDSIASLAAALAKAQCELTNPEKSLVATIGPGRPGEGARSFRYAPLASGLEIVRKALGAQQIATVQTTALDVSSGTVNLTTVLAHASGEWIATDWPVCRIADAESPQRMGAALTYARRYALFTLVGIAGEDDLDAPDLDDGQKGTSMPVEKAPGAAARSRAPTGNGKQPRPPLLEPEKSANLRDELVREIRALNSETEAAEWAPDALVRKNTLTGEDARLVQLAFELRLSALKEADVVSDTGEVEPTAWEPQASSTARSTPVVRANSAVRPSTPVQQRAKRDRTGRVDKSVLSIPEPRRHRDKEHLKFVSSQPCLVCGRTPSDPHHLRFAQSPALGRRVSDEFTVPLCRLHHREVHRAPDEPRWWKRIDIDALGTASRLWNLMHAANDRTPSSPTTVAPLGSGAVLAQDTAPTGRAVVTASAD